MKKRKYYLAIRCPVCSKLLAGVYPKGGDGTALVPWNHVSALDGYTNPCPGSFMSVDVSQAEEKQLSSGTQSRGAL